MNWNKFDLVPVTMGDLYGPVKCEKCLKYQAWTIWTTSMVKETCEFIDIFKNQGIARCDKCGPPETEIHKL